MIFYIVLFIIGVMVIIEWAYFKIAHRIDFSIFLKPDVLSTLAIYYRKEIGIYGIVIVLMFLAIYFYQENKIKKRKNCVIQEVDLADIAKIWLESEEYKQVVKKEIEQELKPHPEEKEIHIIIPDFKEQRSKRLFEFINDKREYFTQTGIRIITDLINLLEKHPAKSVASLFKADSNFKDYKKLVVGDKTSYDILSEISLYTHSMDVVEEIIEIIENKEEANMYYERGIIAALAHDIGKMKALSNYSEKITSDLFKNAPHNVISALYLREKYPEYSKDVIEAVEFHHGAVKKNNIILDMLIEADRKAKEKEIDKWLIEHKEEPQEIKVTDTAELEIDETEAANTPQEEIPGESKPETQDKEEELFEIDESIFEDDEEPQDDIKSILEEKPCNINYSQRGLDLEDLYFIYNSKLYASFIFAKKHSLKGKSATYRLTTDKGEYELMLIEIESDFIRRDFNCDEVKSLEAVNDG